MTLFWALAALLAAAAAAFVLLPLLGRRRVSAPATPDQANLALYREQLKELDADLAAGTLGAEQHEEARRELERRVLEDVRGAAAPASPLPGRGLAVTAGLAVPALAIALYLAVGNPGALAPPEGAAAEPPVTREQVEGMVDRLAARMKESPDDPQGWIMLGRSYSVLDRYAEAEAAYANAIRRAPPDAQLYADYADVLAMARGRTLQGEPEKYIALALKTDPDNVKARALAGTVALQKQAFKEAIAHWEHILRVVPPDSEIAEAVRDSIADARRLAGQAPAGAAATGARVGGLVQLAPALAAKAADGDTVFIFARAVSGPRAPLAVLRRRVSDLPVAFTLDDTMAMAPALKLSGQTEVVIGARVSKSGNPVAQPGDLEGQSPPVKVGNTGVVVTINREVGAAK